MTPVAKCLVPNYLLSSGANAAQCATLNGEPSGKACPPTLTITDLLHEVACERIYVASLYEDRLSECSGQYRKRTRVTLCGLMWVCAKDNYFSYEVIPAEFAHQVEAAKLLDGATILFTGIPIPTLGAPMQLSDGNEHLAIAWNLCDPYRFAFPIGTMAVFAHWLLVRLDKWVSR